jgi:pimeloyl-ACP methyl ester carboxylesterase
MLLPRTTVLILVLAIVPGGCRRKGTDDPAPPPASGTVLVSATIGSEGGTLRVDDPNSPFAGTTLTLPAGALAQPTVIEIVFRQDLERGTLADGPDRLLGDVFGYELRPVDLVLAVPADLSVRYSSAYESKVLPFFLPSLQPADRLADDLAVFAQKGGDTDLQYLPPLGASTSLRTVAVQIQEFGRFFPLHPFLFVGLYQPRLLVDPATPLRSDCHRGLRFVTAQGAKSQSVGQGSLDAFWSADASHNAIVLHGLASSPLAFVGPDDLMPDQSSAGLHALFLNVVAYQYPSTQSIAANANHLYDLIKLHRQPGFGCNLVAHSMGGLVARYLLEQSHLDPRRPQFEAGDPPLHDLVENLVTLGTPHLGSNLANVGFDFFLRNLGVDLDLLQGVLDLREGAPFTHQLNATFVDNPTHYFLIAGNVLGLGGDLVVSVDSATGLPLQPPEQAVVLLGSADDFEHSNLHINAARNGVLDLLISVLAGGFVPALDEP